MLYSTHDFHKESLDDIIKSGVYTIEFLNKPNIYYVGSATKQNNKGRNNNGFHARWREHLNLLFYNKHYNKKLQNNFNKYGKENLFFSIIDFYEPNLCFGAEQYWLNMLDSYKNGYNLTYVVTQPTKGRKLTKEQRKFISDRMLGEKNPQYGKIRTKEEKEHLSIIFSKKIVQYDFVGNLINNWKSINEAANILGIDSGNISKCCNKQQLTYKKYFWFFVDDKIEIKDYIKETLKRKLKAQGNKKLKPICKPILQFDLNDNFIREWSSMREATDFIGAANGALTRACNGEYKKCKGFIWKYKFL